VTPEEMVDMAEYFALLGDETRLAIVAELGEGDKNVSALCEALGVKQPTVSHHLGIMRHHHLVLAERVGKCVMYSLNVSSMQKIRSFLETIAEQAPDTAAPAGEDFRSVPTGPAPEDEPTTPKENPMAHEAPSSDTETGVEGDEMRTSPRGRETSPSLSIEAETNHSPSPATEKANGAVLPEKERSWPEPPPESTLSTRHRLGLLGVSDQAYEELPISECCKWFAEAATRLVKGGIYLVGGEPGIGKSTLALQLSLDLGRLGVRTAYILTEQSAADLAKRAKLMVADWPVSEAENAMVRVEPEEGVYSIGDLPRFLAREILNPSGKHHAAKFVVIDSVQGQGLSPLATRPYGKLYEFCRQCKAAGITVLLVSHVTKRGEIAGPKGLEHNVDCVVVMRKAMAYRPMFVPKNRFGPARLKPILLEIQPGTTRLDWAPHTTTLSTRARTFLGHGMGLAEMQAMVSLPEYGRSGSITAPGLPKREIQQVIGCISQIQDLNLDDLSFSIQCRLPGSGMYQRHFGLPLAMALVGSYLQRSIPETSLYLGEIDLLREVRRIPDTVIEGLAEFLQNEGQHRRLQIYLPRSNIPTLRQQLDTSHVELVACGCLEDALCHTWPDLTFKRR